MAPSRVVLSGPECTGKTSLAAELAGDYGVPVSPEYARDYVAGLDRALGYGDVERIAAGQQRVEDATIARATALRVPLVLLDTDLVSTLVYSVHYYGDCPSWVEREARRRRADLYLLHRTDVEWRADGRQREQPERRDELFLLFRATLRRLGADLAEIHGEWAERRTRARAAIDGLLAAGSEGGRPGRAR